MGYQLLKDLKQFITNKEIVLNDEVGRLNLETYINEYKGLEWFKWLGYLAFYSFKNVSDVSKFIKAVEQEEIYVILSFCEVENLHIDDNFPEEGFFRKLVFSSLFKNYSYTCYEEYIPLDPCDEEIKFENVLDEIKLFLTKNSVMQQEIDFAIEFFQGGLYEGCTYYVSIIESEELSLYYNDQALNEKFQEAIPGYFLSPTKYIIYSWCSDESTGELHHVEPLELLQLIKMYIDKFGDSGRVKDIKNTRKLLYAQKVYDLEQTEYYISKFINKVMSTYCTKTEVMF